MENRLPPLDPKEVKVSQITNLLCLKFCIYSCLKQTYNFTREIAFRSVWTSDNIIL